MNNPLNKIVRSVQAFGRELKHQLADAPPAPPRIGVALGGGFARGLAHIGVFKVLEQENIPVEFIAGTSVGSIIGSAYASGVNAEELQEIACRVRFKDFSRWTFSRFGFFSNDKMAVFLHRLLRCQTFEELRIPMSVTAMDIVTGEPAVFTSGDLIDPVRASCAYPGMFLPVKINGRLLVDGLLAHPVPAVPVRAMGATRVIAVSLRANWVKQRGPRHLLDVVGQCLSIAQEKLSAEWKATSDLIIEPAVGEFAYDHFVRADELVRAGEEAARAALPKIRQWLPASAALSAASLASESAATATHTPSHL
ncbi:MAG TPA: patatin-like phospholipase family protein [Alphaproteobacteria bacterium]|nr:patatin-like phospholipase family protein [Alphaproteobacteria bacterium]